MSLPERPRRKKLRQSWLQQKAADKSSQTEMPCNRQLQSCSRKNRARTTRVEELTTLTEQLGEEEERLTTELERKRATIGELIGTSG